MVLENFKVKYDNLYHGSTTPEISAFRPGRQNQLFYGLYSTTSKVLALRYAGYKSNFTKRDKVLYELDVEDLTFFDLRGSKAIEKYSESLLEFIADEKLTGSVDDTKSFLEKENIFGRNADISPVVLRIFLKSFERDLKNNYRSPDDFRYLGLPNPNFAKLYSWHIIHRLDMGFDGVSLMQTSMGDEKKYETAVIFNPEKKLKNFKEIKI